MVGLRGCVLENFGNIELLLYLLEGKEGKIGGECPKQDRYAVTFTLADWTRQESAGGCDRCMFQIREGVTSSAILKEWMVYQ